MKSQQVKLVQDDTTRVCWLSSWKALKKGFRITLKDDLESGKWTVEEVYGEPVDKTKINGGLRNWNNNI